MNDIILFGWVLFLSFMGFILICDLVAIELNRERAVEFMTKCLIAGIILAIIAELFFLFYIVVDATCKTIEIL